MGGSTSTDGPSGWWTTSPRWKKKRPTERFAERSRPGVAAYLLLPFFRAEGLGAQSQGFLDRGLIRSRDRFFGTTKAPHENGKPGPVGALEGEKQFVNVVQPVLSPIQRRLDVLRNRQGAKHRKNWFVKKRVRYGKQPHNKKSCFAAAETRRHRHLFAEKSACQRGADQFWRLSTAHRHYCEDRNPAAELLFAEQREGLTDASNFPTQSKHRGIQIAQQAV